MIMDFVYGISMYRNEHRPVIKNMGQGAITVVKYHFT